ncbi:3-hydroxyacyl-CoA dehydrogenase [Syntrophomonas zehnderi OL-4]|uniref:3-hydroxybutyryl-CoA dehydrogenase n=1 Tax=Syntrophomonas zehnderi OL-4 TaxID=690567 RepID=A0A0E4C9R4_9FIRM|nr:3-hydroxyacyl-CoA dehydrogenase NAD-binding domain-containing protein [Syntrophomonas zehnderi]CFY10344.1 3-hydroxyacyl-CoA dehydrogenase [Syntrophomonas zehnderi OL-4]
MNIKTIGLLGAGTMGQGIAWTLASADYQVILYDIKQDFCDKAVKAIGKSLGKLEEKGKAPAGTKDAVLNNIKTTGKFEDLAASDFVIEAVFENMEVKKDVYTRLDALLKPEVIIGTNTSSLSITEIAAITKRADRVIGMHFFNPANVMKLVEIIPALQTSEETVAVVTELTKKIGKTPVKVKEGPGFVVNRILTPGMNEACSILYENLATAEDIDTAMKLGANWPMGPLALCDLVGTDIALAVMNTLYEETGDPKYRPSTLLKQYVRAGWLGRKTGRGFFEY